MTVVITIIVTDIVHINGVVLYKMLPIDNTRMGLMLLMGHCVGRIVRRLGWFILLLSVPLPLSFYPYIYRA